MMTQARGHHYHPHSQVLDDNDPAKGLSDINMCHEWPFIVMPGVSESVESEQRSLDTTQPGHRTDKLHQTQILVRHQSPLCPEFPSLEPRGEPGHVCPWSLDNGDEVTW